jgi:hypothetical protein
MYDDGSIGRTEKIIDFLYCTILPPRGNRTEFPLRKNGVIICFHFIIILIYFARAGHDICMKVAAHLPCMIRL